MRQRKKKERNSIHLDSPKIVFDDKEFLVLNKPQGWIVNASGTTTNQCVLQDWLKTNFNYEIARSSDLRSGIVHRLDKETSGLLLIAKTKYAFENLQRQFKEREVEKTYVALVHGSTNPKRGVINEPVGRLPWNRERFGVLPGGREANTEYNTVSNYKKQTTNDEYSLLELKPKTGRTHQIRIHLKHLGYPIVSDLFYAGRKTARADRRWCPRLFLHAKTISFHHPISGKRISFDSPLPPDLAFAISGLERLAS